MAFSEREIRAALRKKESQNSIQPVEDPVSDEEKVSTVLRYCPHCNVVVDDDAVFCQDCGQPLPEKPTSERVPTEEARGENSSDSRSLWSQSGVQRWQKREKQGKQASELKKFVIAASLLVFFLVGVSVFLSPPPPPHPSPPKSEAKLQQTLPATRTRINYKVVSRFYFGSAGAGRVVVIDPKYGNDPDLRRLGVQLRDEVDISSQVAVYDDERAALLREGALDDRLSKEDADFHDRHCLGLYTGFGRLGYANFIITPEGLDGPAVTVKY